MQGAGLLTRMAMVVRCGTRNWPNPDVVLSASHASLGSLRLQRITHGERLGIAAVACIHAPSSEP